MVVPVTVTNDRGLALPSARATPKSAILTWPLPATSRFSGFRSRWMMPWLSPCARPASTFSSIPASWANVSAGRYGRSDPRGKYSIAM